MRAKYFAKLLAVAVCSIAVLAGRTTQAASKLPRQDVLVLHSYHKADWTDRLQEGIAAALAPLPNIDLAVEYMDTKRVASAEYLQLLHALYALKYDRTRFAVVIVSDDNAYHFALAHQADLFHDAPIVFCGVNRFDPAALRAHPNVTGVVERGDFAETLAFAVRTRPHAGGVHIITDKTRTAAINRDGLLEVLQRAYPGLHPSFLEALSLDELAQRLKTLPPDDFAFFIAYWQDAQGQAVTPDDLAGAFAQSSVPIFGRSEWMIGRGQVGGKCVSGFHQGEAAGRLARRILQGEAAAAIPVITDSPNRFMFDYPLVVKFGIPLEWLPAGSILAHQPAPSFFFKYQGRILLTGTIFLLLLILVALLAFNIVTRRHVEQTLKSKEKHLRTLLENAADAIFVCDEEARLLEVNRRACESLGYRREELLALKVQDVDADFKDIAQLNDFWQRLTPDQPLAVETHHRRKDGSTFPVLLRVGVIESQSRRLFLGLAHDITERKMMLAELEEREARYRQLVQHAPAGIYTFDVRTMRFSEVNDVMCSYTGYTEEEFLALDPFDLLLEESRRVFQKQLGEVFNGNPNPGEVEYHIRGKNGREFWVLVNSRFVFDDGVPVRAMSVAHDITRLRETEAAKRKLEAHLQQVQRLEALGTLAGGIAHDFNNLLTGIQGNASLMRLDLPGGSPLRENVGHIEQYVQRGVALTRQLLGMARGGKYEARPTDLGTLLQNSVAMFGRTKREIRIQTGIAQDLWAAAVDPGQIEQVLLNLFVNAWQAMPGGGDLVVAAANTEIQEDAIMGEALPPGRYVAIRVTDSGIGMDETTQARIFDPFFTTKEIGRGTGLGLASAYGIVKNHGGAILVESALGCGTTFTIYLPACDAAPGVAPAADHAAYGGRERILLVDDESMVRDVGRRMLERLGYTVVTARSGEEALSYAREHLGAIDLVILDMIMPELSGSDTFDLLMRVDSELKVLLSSGYSFDGQAAAIMDRGCAGFLQKPFDFGSLAQKVREVLAV